MPTAWDPAEFIRQRTQQPLVRPSLAGAALPHPLFDNILDIRKVLTSQTAAAKWAGLGPRPVLLPWSLRKREGCPPVGGPFSASERVGMGFGGSEEDPVILSIE